MAYRLVWSEEARTSYVATLDYIDCHLHNRRAAIDFADDFENKLNEIAAFPACCEFSQDTLLKERGYRKALVGSYVLLYRADEENQTVYLVNLFYGGRDYAKLV